jgi:hypothetical protein
MFADNVSNTTRLPDWIPPGSDEFDHLARAIRTNASADELNKRARDAGLEHSRRIARSDCLQRESLASFKRFAFSKTIPILLVISMVSLGYAVWAGSKTVLVLALSWHNWIRMRKLAQSSTFKRSRSCLVCRYDLSGVSSAVEPELSEGADLGPLTCPECGHDWPCVPIFRSTPAEASRVS